MITNKTIDSLKLGDMRHVIKVQKPKVNTDEGGGHPELYQDVLEAFAYIKSINQAEQFRFQQLGHTITHQVLIRYEGVPVTADMVVNFNGRILRIHGVTNWEEKDEFYVLTCGEEQPEESVS